MRTLFEKKIRKKKIHNDEKVSFDIAFWKGEEKGIDIDDINRK